MCSCDAPAVYEDQVRTCRKPTTCEECRQPIAKGEQYHAISGCWDGSWSRYTVCLFCEELRVVAQADDDLCGCIAFGQLHETLADWFGWDGESEEGELLDALFPFRVPQRAEAERQRQLRLVPWYARQVSQAVAGMGVTS
jgi:hypothetical protein